MPIAVWQKAQLGGFFFDPFAGFYYRCRCDGSQKCFDDPFLSLPYPCCESGASES